MGMHGPGRVGLPAGLGERTGRGELPGVLERPGKGEEGALERPGMGEEGVDESGPTCRAGAVSATWVQLLWSFAPKPATTSRRVRRGTLMLMQYPMVPTKRTHVQAYRHPTAHTRVGSCTCVCSLARARSRVRPPARLPACVLTHTRVHHSQRLAVLVVSIVGVEDNAHPQPGLLCRVGQVGVVGKIVVHEFPQAVAGDDCMAGQ